MAELIGPVLTQELLVDPCDPVGGGRWVATQTVREREVSNFLVKSAFWSRKGRPTAEKVHLAVFRPIFTYTDD